MNEHVILLHGLWLRAFTLATLRRRLEREGYAVHSFDYASVFSGCDAIVDKLVEFARSIAATDEPPRKVHLVGHSLGGLVALHALRRFPDLAPGCVVCLGSPLRGSSIARGLAKWPGGSFLVGRNLGVLTEGFERWDGSRPVGAIAGRLPVGLGALFGVLPTPHDGTVSVEETRLPGIADHCVVAAAHTGLPFSEEVAAQTVAFLRNERFRRAAA